MPIATSSPRSRSGPPPGGPPSGPDGGGQPGSKRQPAATDLRSSRKGRGTSHHCDYFEPPDDTAPAQTEGGLNGGRNRRAVTRSTVPLGLEVWRPR
eukprot:4416428-Alexandrium_andersonii.AAC.1